MPTPVIELLVNNHPGVMWQITGLFSRRGFYLEGILCGASGDGARSRMLLLVNEDQRLAQLLRELAKLHDVLSVGQRDDIRADAFQPPV